MELQWYSDKAVAFARNHPIHAGAIIEAFSLFRSEVEEGGSIEHEWELFCDECEENTGDR